MELISYNWKEKDGVTFDEPVKFNDDGVDGLRYGSYSARKGHGIVISKVSRDSNSMYDWLD